MHLFNCSFSYKFHKFVADGPIDSKSGSAQVMGWHQTGDKPLSELMLIQVGDVYVYIYMFHMKYVILKWVFVSEHFPVIYLMVDTTRHQAPDDVCQHWFR